MTSFSHQTYQIGQRIGRMFRLYLVALVLLFGCVATSALLIDMEAEQLKQDAKLINVSGRQRMLSQRIIYLASEYQTAAPGDRAATGVALSQAIDTFEAAITLFETAHDGLLIAAAGVPEAQALFFGPIEGVSRTLDARVRDYIENARRVLADPGDTAALGALRRIEKAGILRDLDQVVTAFEGSSTARITMLRQIERYLLILVGVVILIEVFFVFLPSQKILRRNIDDLSQAQDTLRTANTLLQKRTDQIEAEREKLNLALTDSEALRLEQAQFTYALSHDLKSPTNTIGMLLGEVHELSQQTGTQEMRDMIVHAQSSVNRMGVLIHDTLAYSQATHGDSRAEIVDMQVLVREILADLQADIVTSKAEIRVGRLEPVAGYRSQLRSLVQNLVLNGLTYQPPGARPVLQVSCQRTAPDGPYLLEVSDNGIGIDPKDHDRVFDLFKRLHLQTVYPGSGLGLATCKRIALNHGGQITLRSTPGTGSTFAVTLHPDLLCDTQDQEDIAA